jgi:hypothetical protein
MANQSHSDRAAALAGTPRAYDKCGGCRDMRIRHLNQGNGPCTQPYLLKAEGRGGRILEFWLPCQCQGFRESEAQ